MAMHKTKHVTYVVSWEGRSVACERTFGSPAEARRQVREVFPELREGEGFSVVRATFEGLSPGEDA